ncbi:acyl-CoA dehydrogenase [Pontivivens insulae]|uniref:3-methylmercaptopropionyl-CoA dehydrogenase n=1 Tax=Pontivivens insulae TaxID=1639689 RepID=A0A2R8AER5_9RHOB|nr:acyl-CoA dehydrogenase [Pontivivens insulae]RED11987.1 butyryl-CoA dehydrogenase [Pontivivens insulae]SPF30743.1 3-methylmercaptopropionyl-CoA dehydrogenase [Pontivivens insulae]
MPNILNARDIDFLMDDVFGLADILSHPLYADHDREGCAQILQTAEKLAEDLFQPFAAKADANEPWLEDGVAHVIPETETALKAYAEAGFPAAGFAQADGGMQLPYIVGQAAAGWFVAANCGFAAYPFLSAAAGNLLAAYGTDEQKSKYLTPLVEGRAFGTMCLSEPHAGSSLGDIRTRAERQQDGSFRLFGSKMWISGGDHEMGENIFHLVLAKIPGGPAGTKGISLFLVPRRLEDGSRNDVATAGLNHKMGYRGTTNCALNFGEHDGAVGWLVGDENRGLNAMFHMMNEARTGVGHGAAVMGVSGYLHALAYAKDRTQGRAVDERDPTSPMIPLIEHADIRRQLMQARAYAEGSLALSMYAASLVDRERMDDKTATQLLAILTPIIKSWPSEFALRANDIAIQIHGGYGYTRDYPVERLYRDNRLNPIHEGTKGIQGMDLLGRKVVQDGGAPLRALSGEIGTTLSAADAFPEERDQLAVLLERVGEVTLAMASAAMTDPKAYLANATIYLDMLGHVVVAWLWLRQAIAVRDHSDTDFAAGKVTTMRYFFRYELPVTGPQLDLLAELDRTCLEAEATQF